MAVPKASHEPGRLTCDYRELNDGGEALARHLGEVPSEQGTLLHRRTGTAVGRSVAMSPALCIIGPCKDISGLSSLIFETNFVPQRLMASHGEPCLMILTLGRCNLPEY
jgi:hypothetical protein